MTRKANNPQNLKPAKKGEIRNPLGRPKGSKDMTTIMREMLDTLVDVKDKNGAKLGKKSYKMLIIAKLMKKATDGDLRAVEILLDRMEGKASQPVEHTGEIDSNINLNIVSNIQKLLNDSKNE
jgi:hypothetical protein